MTNRRSDEDLGGIEDLREFQPRPIRRIIKSSGHCYDGCGWNICDAWTADQPKFGPSIDRCALFGNAEKFRSESLKACNEIYGVHYEGKP